MEAKKQKQDLTQGPLASRIFLLAIPMALTSILQQLFNAADIAVIGRLVGANAMAAVGANSPIVCLIVNTVTGISLGSNVVIANAVGRKDESRVEKAVQTSVIFALAAGIMVAVLGELVAEPLLRAISVPDEVLDMSVLYLRIYLTGIPVIVLYNFETAILRSVGDTKTPLIVLIVSGIVNVGLNVFFVACLHMTVEGVALATMLSNLISAGILMIVLIRTELSVKLRFQNMNVDFDCLKEILRIGLPTGIQNSIFSSANILVQSAINSLGTVVMAGVSASINLENGLYFVVLGFSQACTTFTSQNDGARKYERCKKSFYLCLAEATGILIVAMIAIFAFSTEILALFNTDPEVIAAGCERLMFMVPLQFFSVIYDTVACYMRGFGISLLPSIISLVGIVTIRVFFVFVIFPIYHTFASIMWCYPISLGSTAIAGVIALLIIRPAGKRMVQAHE